MAWSPMYEGTTPLWKIVARLDKMGIALTRDGKLKAWSLDGVPLSKKPLDLLTKFREHTISRLEHEGGHPDAKI